MRDDRADAVGAAVLLGPADRCFLLGVGRLDSGLFRWRPLTLRLSTQRMEIFTGMLVYDTFTVYMRSLLLLFLVLLVVLHQADGHPDREDAADIYTLVFGATLGMCLMVSANHLLMVFLAVEMASVPSYALAGPAEGPPRRPAKRR